MTKHRIFSRHIRRNQTQQRKHLASTPKHPKQLPAAPAKMPREEYQVPTASTQRGATRDTHDTRSVMTYTCGDCGGSVSLGKDSLVACPHCAGRVLYKERTKR